MNHILILWAERAVTPEPGHRSDINCAAVWELMQPPLYMAKKIARSAAPMEAYRDWLLTTPEEEEGAHQKHIASLQDWVEKHSALGFKVHLEVW